MKPDPSSCLKERHSFQDYLYWILMISVPVITACVALYRASVGLLILYVMMGIGLVLVIMRFFCSHCPHYRRDDQTLRCMFFWGVPKPFKKRDEPLSGLEKAVSLIAPAAVVLFPVPRLLEDTTLFLIYVLSLGGFLFTILRYECTRCTYKDCPANRVPPGEAPGEGPVIS